MKRRPGLTYKCENEAPWGGGLNFDYMMGAEKKEKCI